ncbi:MAG: serine protease [Planctomycetota bacterium]|nr:MAG: serine protease [Planctomycetota bacterium]
MPNWSEILKEIGSSVSPHDRLRRKYLVRLWKHTKRNVIAYYSGWLQKGAIRQGGVSFEIDDSDKNGFMTAVHKLDRSKGLDLLLHTPGGQLSAAESIVDYLRTLFDNDIRAIVPQLAMSAGTLIALACNEIVMGKQSSIGPIDPQFGGTSAHGIVEEWETAKREIGANPNAAAYWQFILSKYGPSLVGDCQKAIAWSNTIAKEWLISGMLRDEGDAIPKANAIVQELGDHSLTLAHDRHISMEKALSLGLKVSPLEQDPQLQDAVLSVHHAMIHTLSATPAYKIIENHLGHAFINTVQLLPR